MILSEKLILLRKEQELSQEQLAEQLGVSRQAVSKWESGASIPDLDKIINMSRLFGVSVDYLVKDEAEETGGTSPESRDPGVRVVSMEEADRYLETVQCVSGRIAAGVAMCILSPVVLILLAGAAEYRVLPIGEGLAAGVGVAVLLGLVAAAVAVFILNGMPLGKYEYLQKEPLLTAYGVSGVVQRQMAAYERIFHTHIALGVVLCVLSPLPLIIAAVLDRGFLVICGVCVLLFLVAMGAYLFVTSGMIWNSYHILLQEGDYTPEHKRQEKRMTPIASVYWCLITAVYLGVSFFTGAWGRTWIIWPVAGVAFAAVTGIYNLAAKDK